jgi:hypothetical protein
MQIYTEWFFPPEENTADKVKVLWKMAVRFLTSLVWFGLWTASLTPFLSAGTEILCMYTQNICISLEGDILLYHSGKVPHAK